MKYNIRVIRILLVSSVLLSVSLGLGAPKAQADEFTSPSFKVLDPVIKPGAGFSTSTGFRLWSSVGQEAIGLSQSLGFGLKGGFLYFPAPAAAPSTPAAPTARIFGIDYPLILKPIPTPKICDFNNDSRCNIIDLSIMIFYYGRRGPAIERYDLSSNDVVDFPDVSILFYYWTG